jgi:hypothetical protein
MRSGETSAATVRIDVSSTRTGVPRPERRARLQQTARIETALLRKLSRASPADATPDRLEAPEAISVSSSSDITGAPESTTADSQVLRLSLGLTELSIDSVYGCLPAADSYVVQSTATSARRAASKHESTSEA